MKDGPAALPESSSAGAEEAATEKPFRNPIDPAHGLEDGRRAWQWEAKYPPEARTHINREAWLAGRYFAFFLAASAVAGALSASNLSWGPFTVSPDLVLTYLLGGLGSTTFSIKWLIHSVATGKWHVERIYWRAFVPLVGGVYALVVLNLMTSGFMGPDRPPANGVTLWGLAFLVGYFSDGVSGLLSNVANAVFGTVERK